MGKIGREVRGFGTMNEEFCKNCGEHELAHEDETMNCPSAKRYGRIKFEAKEANSEETEQ